MKTFSFVRQSTPSEYGYKDLLNITVGNSLLYRCNCSTWCNPVSPVGHVPYYSAYGAVALGTYQARCVQNDLYGKCLLIQNGETVKGVWPNIHHDWNKVISEVFVHQGGLKSSDPNWRGSAGCFTLPEHDFLMAMTFVNLLDEVTVVLGGRNYTLGLFVEPHI